MLNNYSFLVGIWKQLDSPLRVKLQFSSALVILWMKTLLVGLSIWVKIDTSYGFILVSNKVTEMGSMVT